VGLEAIERIEKAVVGGAVEAVIGYKAGVMEPVSTRAG
jgi:hypothetical protein